MLVPEFGAITSISNGARFISIMNHDVGHFSKIQGKVHLVWQAQ